MRECLLNNGAPKSAYASTKLMFTAAGRENKYYSYIPFAGIFYVFVYIRTHGRVYGKLNIYNVRQPKAYGIIQT